MMLFVEREEIRWGYFDYLVDGRSVDAWNIGWHCLYMVIYYRTGVG